MPDIPTTYRPVNAVGTDWAYIDPPTKSEHCPICYHPIDEESCPGERLHRAEAMCERLAEALEELASHSHDYGDIRPRAVAVNQAWSAIRAYRQAKRAT